MITSINSKESVHLYYEVVFHTALNSSSKTHSKMYLKVINIWDLVTTNIIIIYNVENNFSILWWVLKNKKIYICKLICMYVLMQTSFYLTHDRIIIYNVRNKTSHKLFRYSIFLAFWTQIVTVDQQQARIDPVNTCLKCLNRHLYSGVF